MIYLSSNATARKALIFINERRNFELEHVSMNFHFDNQTIHIE